MVRSFPQPPYFLLANTINFDDVPDGTAIDTQYSNKGVTFASVTDQPPSTWSAFARSWSTAQSQPNVISVNAAPHDPFFDAYIGGIQATFASPQRWISISARPVTIAEDIGQQFTHKPYIEGFDAQGNYLQIAYYGPSYGDTEWGRWKPLILISTSANIASVRFSSQYHGDPPHVFALFDYLQFSDRIPPIPLGPGLGR
jgi:hypothetical protein